MLLCGAACPGQSRGFLYHPGKFRKNQTFVEFPNQRARASVQSLGQFGVVEYTEYMSPRKKLPIIDP